MAEGARATSTTRRVAIGVAAGLAAAAGLELTKKWLGHGNSKPEEEAAAGSEVRPREGASAERSPLRSASPLRERPRRSKSASRDGATTKEQLYRKARRLNVPGRSKMTKAELERAIQRAQR